MCQRLGEPSYVDTLSIYPILPFQQFAKWGLDSIGTIKPRALEVTNFLYQNIMTWFGWPIDLVSNQGTHFLNKFIEDLITTKHMIIQKNSSMYNPQCNSQVESGNKILIKTLKKIMKAIKKRIGIGK